MHTAAVGAGTTKVGVVRPHAHDALWPSSGIQCMCQAVVGVFSWRLIIVGYQDTSHNGIDIIGNWVSNEGT